MAESLNPMPDPVLADTLDRRGIQVFSQRLKKGSVTRVEKAGGKDVHSEEADRCKTTQALQ